MNRGRVSRRFGRRWRRGSRAAAIGGVRRLFSAIACTSCLAACSDEPVRDVVVPNGDAQRGRTALMKYECGVCHVIPGVPGAVGHVGPPLDSFARHVYVAGKFPNTPQVLVRWIVDAPAMAPETGMPAIALSPLEARDVAAYLYSLD